MILKKFTLLKKHKKHSVGSGFSIEAVLMETELLFIVPLTKR